ncbi:MAG TPA: hypothetical protein VFG45_12640 [Candidatus Nitrosocosmicus sp.]|nr:hypothetical protein [Candidatus Nitrosocosmicus sp.]
MNEEYYNQIAQFSSQKGLTVNSFINSIMESQAKFFISCNTFNIVHIPKRMLSSLFSIVTKAALQKFANDLGYELADAMRTLDTRNEVTFQSAITFIHNICKFALGSEPRIVQKNDHEFSIFVNHNMGENCSYFFAFKHKEYSDSC